MKYQHYYPIDVVNGVGTRCTLFVSGCEHFCAGCHNSTTWNPDVGHLYTQALEDQIIQDLGDTRVAREGLSLSGGDPLHPANLDTIQKLVKRVKTTYPDKDIWLWTGYTIEEMSSQQKQVLTFVDTLIDGRYEQDQRDLTLPWRGSRNQRLIDMTDIREETAFFE